MNEHAIVGTALRQAALPLSPLAAGYSIVSYRRGRGRTKIGRILLRDTAPFRFWLEVAGELVVAVID